MILNGSSSILSLKFWIALYAIAIRLLSNLSGGGRRGGGGGGGGGDGGGGDGGGRGGGGGDG